MNIAFRNEDYLPVPNTSETFAHRVFTRVEVTANCWWWTGAPDAYGYGVIGRGARGAGSVRAHRAVWELLVGAIPEGLVFDHLCRNHLCVNPEHGEIITLAENVRRGYGPSVMHSLRDHCPKGHPKDGVTREGHLTRRYCKTCARAKSSARYYRLRQADRFSEAEVRALFAQASGDPL